MVSVSARETVAYPLAQGEEITMELDLPDQVQAPVTQGEIAGAARWYQNGREVGWTYLVWSGSAAQDVTRQRQVHSLLDFLRPGGQDEKAETP